jgi:creatinine amidohydrolase
MERHMDVSNDIFAGTIAELTWFEVDEAAKAGAILLWGFGVIEQHGPHLPTGTDVYLPSAHLREVKAELKARGIEALIVPPYYWGINNVSGSFPASYRVKPETMKALMADVFDSIEADGFQHVFCFSGHGEAQHNLTIHQGAQAAAQRTGLDISFVAEPALAKRIGIELTDEQLTLLDPAPAGGEAGPYIDVHAGRWETSMMLCSCPGLVRERVRKALRSTEYGAEDLAEWRRGLDHARRKTPLGYFGDPAAANAEEGLRSLSDAAQRAAIAIERRLMQKKGQ